jgi:hypothetical protein
MSSTGSWVKTARTGFIHEEKKGFLRRLFG